MAKDRTVYVRLKSGKIVVFFNQEPGQYIERRRQVDEVEASTGDTVVEYVSMPQSVEVEGRSASDVVVCRSSWFRFNFILNDGTEGDRDVFVPHDNQGKALEYFLISSRTAKILRSMNHPPKMTILSITSEVD